MTYLLISLKSIEIPTSFRLSYSQAMIALGLSSESTFSQCSSLFTPPWET